MAVVAPVAAPVRYSTNSVFRRLKRGDDTFEIIGYIEEIRPITMTPRGVRLLKIVLTNGDKKLLVLFWHDMIDMHTAQLQVNRIIRIETADCVDSKINERDMKFVKVELIVRTHTVIHSLGFHTPRNLEYDQTVQDIDFAALTSSNGLIRVQAYLRTTFRTVTPRNGIGYGIGAITNGDRRIPIPILNYATLDIQKGSCIKVTGLIKEKDGVMKIVCENDSAIQIVADEEIMAEERLDAAHKMVKRPHPASSESDDE